jgi:murein tripeptide amidase MpaA
MAKVMNITEIESALVYFAKTYKNLCKRITLPEKTHEKRTCHALAIGKNIGNETPSVLIIGGVHAREWGGPDILVNFAGDLLRAYKAGKGLKYLNKSFSAGDIKRIVENTNVVVFPCVNPDGVQFSHTKTHLWRKNRNPGSALPSKPDTIGVDINRNYDFLWDYKKYFHPAARQDTSLASDDPADETFHGTEPFSEPETRNVKWLMDQLPKMALFMDVHSYSGDVLYTWGADEDQSTDATQTFANPAFDQKRGRIGDGYKEYISPADYETATDVARSVADAMKTVRGKPYKPLQAVGLYPTAGTSDDYCFGRHIVDPKLSKTFSYTIEFNFGTDASTFLATGDPTVLDETIRDVVPGLIALCLALPKAAPPLLSHELTALVGAPSAALQTAPYRTGLANDVSRLLAAYETVASLGGPAGDAARQGILKGIQSAASAEGSH